jgi:hypothetical protein
MSRFLSAFLAAWLLSAAGLASASFHTWQIAELYSNADGTIQFVVLRESQGASGENLLAGRALTVTRTGGAAKSYIFTNDLPSPNTANRYVLIATQGYVNAALSFTEFAAAMPDYVIPNQFLPTDGGSLNYAGVDSVSFGPLPVDGSLALYTPVSGSYVDVNVARNFAGGVTTLPTLAVTAVEYYNPSLRHYFISNLQPDIDALDSGRIAGWVRTGLTFYVFANPGGGLNPVCRFYIPPQHGDSHFFSADPAECARIQSLIGFDPNYSGYILETSSAFYIALPNTFSGACPVNTTAVYRLWNARVDSNHRYTIDPVVKAQMQAIGYIAEGYGPNAVAMCAPV